MYAIKNAAFVVADSFHAAVFSIIYHKPFMSYSLDDTRNRLDSLYADLGITGHFIGESVYQPIEYNILLYLTENRGRVFNTAQIYEAVWDEDAIASDNIIAVHIRHIREKIEINPKEPRYLKVVWGQGYKVEKL